MVRKKMQVVLAGRIELPSALYESAAKPLSYASVLWCPRKESNLPASA